VAGGQGRALVDRSADPYAKNSRTHSEAQVAQLAASMQEWGWTNPVLADEAGGVICGHARILAARQLGYAEVPVMVARGWSDAQKRAYVIADNQLALNAGWDRGNSSALSSAR
jgi:ParB-like chromosome segregation protein Spo0J